MEVGLLLQVYMYADGSMEEKDITLKSRIAEVYGQELAIEVPIEEGSGRMRHLLQVTEISVAFMGEHGLRYSFPSKVRGTANDDNIPLFIIEKPTERMISKSQRRNFLRVPIELDVSIIVQNPVKMLHLKTVDLSGGGLTFRIPDSVSLDSGQTLAGALSMPKEKNDVNEIHFSGVVIRKLEASPERPVPLYAIQFVEVEERNRDQIIGLCLRRQLELHRKLNL